MTIKKDETKTILFYNVDTYELNKQRLSLMNVLFCENVSIKDRDNIEGLLNMLNDWFDREYPPI